MGLISLLVGKRIGVGQGAAGPVVDLRVWVSDGFAPDDLGNGKGNVISPARKVDEDAMGSGYRDTLGHGTGKGGNRFQLADRLVLRALGRGALGEEGRSGENGDGEQQGAGVHAGLGVCSGKAGCVFRERWGSPG